MFVLGPCGRVGAGGKACRRPFLKGPFGAPHFESRTVSPNCRGTYFVTLFLGRIPAPFLGAALGQGPAKRRRRCVEALCALGRSLCRGIGRGGRDCSARVRWLLGACAAVGVAFFRVERCVVGQALRVRRVRMCRQGLAGCCWAHRGAGSGTGEWPLILRRRRWMQEPWRVQRCGCGLPRAGGKLCGVGLLVGVGPLVFEHGRSHCKSLIARPSACWCCWCCRWFVAVRRCAFRYCVGSSVFVQCRWSRNRHAACMLCPHPPCPVGSPLGFGSNPGSAIGRMTTSTEGTSTGSCSEPGASPFAGLGFGCACFNKPRCCAQHMVASRDLCWRAFRPASLFAQVCFS